MELNFKEEEPAITNFYYSVLEDQVRTHLNDSKARITESKTEGRLNLDEREVLEDELCYLKDLLEKAQGRESSTRSYIEQPQVQTEVIQGLNFEEEDQANVNFCLSVLEHQVRTHLKDNKARLTESKTEGRLNLDVQEDLLVCYLDEREVLEDELYHLLDLLEKTQGRQNSTRSYTDKSQVQTDVQQDLLAFLGEGSFGKVAKCLNLRNNETVAIKIHKSHLSNDDIEQEVAMLQALRAVDPDKNNLVRFIDSFDCQNCYCLAFEMLDKSLWDLMMDRRLTPLTLNEIRPITQQLLVAFHALKGLGIIHTDLKADNIMLVNHQDQPFKVKLIDFGLALPASKARIGMTMQIRSFRAPEVFLGLPISEAIDMWGLGCVMAFLYFSNYLFSHSSSYKTMKDICQMVGQPEDHLLNAGTKASHYFIKKVDSNNLEWRLMTAVENEHAKNPGDTGDDSEDDCYRRSVAERYRDFNLGGAVKAYMTMEDALEYEDGMEFLDFLKRLLHLDGERRLTPIQALQHNFITLAHLKDHSSTSYTEQAHEFMSVCTINPN
uniref:Protein kinase domain-containing protein n=1 Tax=Monopterus albus TaxID=43700 RepID=A0A3Q3KE68_MONAL